jgi:hypothetical protein
MNPAGHPVWWILMLAVLGWYSTITIYVSFKGAFDIKHMLARLKGNRSKDRTPE